MDEMRAIVSGRVQFVMYRDFTRRKAAALGLRGYVRNLPDGTVEVVAQGERMRLERLLATLRRGSILSRVEDVDAAWRLPSRRFDGFHIVTYCTHS